MVGSVRVARALRAAYCGNRDACDTCEVHKLAVCGVLDRDELAELTAIVSGRRLEAGRTLFAEGDVAEEVFSLTEGMLKLYKMMSDGRRQIVGFLVPGDFFGLAFARTTYAYSAEAVVPTGVCRFRRPQFLELLERFPALEKEILGRTSTELAAAQEQMLLLGRKMARERVASFIITLARRCQATDGKPLPLPMTRADIADYLGLTIETVSRTLTGLRREGLIALPNKHEVRIARPAELARVAGS